MLDIPRNARSESHPPRVAFNKLLLIVQQLFAYRPPQSNTRSIFAEYQSVERAVIMAAIFSSKIGLCRFIL